MLRNFLILMELFPKKIKLRVGLIALTFQIAICPAYAIPATSVSQYGVTFTFDRSYEVGQYANGDFWVVGPILITAVSPVAEISRISNSLTNAVCSGNSAGVARCVDWCATNSVSPHSAQCGGPARGYGVCNCDRIRHGWQLNPLPVDRQAFDDRAGLPDITLAPNLPAIVPPGTSVVKAISRNPESTCNADNLNSISCLKTAVVLTVLASVPPSGGRQQFRPPYVGTNKAVYTTSQLRTTLLPSFAPVSNTPTLSWVYERYRRVQLDHLPGATGRATHPIDNMPDYGGDLGANNGDAGLRLLLNDPLNLADPNNEKAKGLIAFVQYGIDIYHMALNGYVWSGGGGYRPGQRLPMAFAAVLLGEAEMKDNVKNYSFFDEDQGVLRGHGGTALFGFIESLNEESYWRVVADWNAGNRTLPDPYGYIDGGHYPGSGYQYCCISQPFKGQLLARELMPSLKEAWDDLEIQEYVDRWVTFGAWAQPDPCAPADGRCAGGPTPGMRCTSASEPTACGSGGTCDLNAHWKTSADSHYGVTYGPDGHGGCILDSDPTDGIGRFPRLHGATPDGGNYDTRFQKAMWAAYRKVLVIAEHPQDVQTAVGDSASFRIRVVGASDVTYQWKRDNQVIAGATSAQYTTPLLSAADNGARFSCQAISPVGSIVSNSATLHVSMSSAPQPPSRLSVRSSQ